MYHHNVGIGRQWIILGSDPSTLTLTWETHFRILCGGRSFWWSNRLNKSPLWDRPPMVWASSWARLQVGQVHFWVKISFQIPLRFFAKIAEKGRRAWSIKTCLSTTSKPQTIKWSDDVNSLTMQVFWSGNNTLWQLFVSAVTNGLNMVLKLF